MATKTRQSRLTDELNKLSDQALLNHLYELTRGGSTANDIAKSYNCSRQALHVALSARGISLKEIREQVEDERVEEVRSHWTEKPELTKDEIGALFPHVSNAQINSISKESFRDSVRREERLRSVSTREESYQQSVEKMVDAIRRVDKRRPKAERGTHLGVSKYTSLRTENEPTSASIIRVIRWDAALIAAGLPTSGFMHTRPNTSFSEEEIARFVKQWMKQTDSFSARSYEEWAKGVEGAPSGTTVRNRTRMSWRGYLASLSPKSVYSK